MKPPDQVILVAGASRPIGRAIARRFGMAGAQLILPYIDDWPESVQEMKAEFEDSAFKCLFQPCDLTDKKEPARLADLLRERFGYLDLLVNNIERGGMPIVHGSYAREINEHQWEIEFNTTVTAKWNLFQHTLPLLRKGHQASVINISSIAGIVGRSGPASPIFSDGYASANRAVSSLTETWAREGAPEVRVNEIMLGLIQTRHGEGTRGWREMSAAQRRAVLDHTLLAREGTVEEVAEIVYFLASQAHYMTGSIIRLDGGYVLGGDRVTPPPSGVPDL
jgi:3-oxoacyl-[acyl-carrier protein] reductase